MGHLQGIFSTAVTAFILSTVTVTAGRGNGTEKCTMGNKFIEHSTCSYNNTSCDIPFVIGKCLSCEPSTCEVVSGECFLDLDMNSSFTADLKTGMIYSKLPPPKSCEELNDRMCGAMNREGFLCSQCKPGYGPAPYSSTVKCFECKDGSTRQWLLYLALELVPSTVFYFVVILFNIRTTAPPYTAFVFLSQFFAFLYKIQPFIRLSLNFRVNKVLLHGILTLISFWNLDFFRHVVPPFCISSKLTDLHVLLLECVSALYPISLVILTFLCIELHARNFRPLVILWKPVHKYFANCRRKLDPKSSVIAAFATFMSLSFSKILVIALLATFSGSLNLARGGRGQGMRGLYDLNLQGNTTAEYWKQLAATPYFIPLLIMLIIVQLPTLLLLLYPIKAFRRLLTCCGSSRYHAIYVFIDTFQGHYKDGTNGSQDYRAASSISFLLRTLFCVLLGGTKVRYGLPTSKLGTYLSLTSVLVIVSLFYGMIQPCKKKYMNVIESVVYCAAGLILLSLGAAHTNYVESRSHSFKQNFSLYISLYLSLIFLVIPSLMLLVTFIFKIFTGLCCVHGSKRAKKVWGYMTCDLDASSPQELPDRLEHPLDYEHLN